MTTYPRLRIDLAKISHNAAALCELCHARSISVAAVTKLFCADERVVKALCKAPVDYLADSRLSNIAAYPQTDKKKMLLRAPMPDQVEEVVKLCDVSLNSELSTLRMLAEAAARQQKKHAIVLMIDMGDLREGIYYGNTQAILSAAAFVAQSRWLTLFGLGLNLTCYGSIIPTKENMDRLIETAMKIEAYLGVRLPFLSGGNSSSLHLLESGEMPRRITNLRLGESIARGEETAYQQRVKGLKQDAITLEAGLVELQSKPSYPEGEIGLNAFGEKPSFEDRGRRLRGIVALGRQDTDHTGLACMDKGVEIIGASSDHLIVDLTQSGKTYRVGDILRFSMDYSAILRGFTSMFVGRTYVGGE